MKRYIQILTVLFVFTFLSTTVLFADNTLQIVGTQTNVNSIATISVNMENDDLVVAFQIDIPIPSQLTYVSGTATLNEARISDHVISDTLLPNGILRIIAYSMSNEPFTGNTGQLMTFQLQTHSFPGEYLLDFETAVLGDTQSINIITSTQNGILGVMGPDISVSSPTIDFGRVPLLGTNDRYLTVYNTGNTDLNIQQITSSSSFFTVIGTTVLTIGAGSSSNLQLRFNSVIKKTYADTLTIYSNDADQGNLEIYMSAVAFAVNELHTGSISAFSGDYALLDFTINNMEPVVSFQFDLVLPEQLSFAADSAFLSSRKTNHNVSANMINNNILRVVAFSSDNQWFLGDDGIILQLGFNVEGIGGYYGIGITNVVIGDILGLNSVSAYTGGSLQIAAADISASNSLNFGDVSILESSTESITIYNYGNDTLEIGSLQFSSSSFSSTQSFPLNINPGNSSPLEIIFSNANEGTYTSTVKLFSNDPDENPFVVNLTGYSFVPNYISVYDSMYSYGDTMFVDIVVDNLESFTGFQFDLHYTDSLTCLVDQVQLGQRAGDHTFQISQIGSNSIRLLAFSLSQAEFTGNSGAIISIPFVSEPGVYGAIPLTIENAILGNSQSEDILWGINNEAIFIAKPQEIVLQSGWNIISLNVTPYTTEMISILQPLINSSNLIKVIDETGGFIQEIPGTGWINTIGEMANTEGYYIKVTTNDTLFIEGSPVALPYSIPLQTGWNNMGYPLQTTQDALTAIQSLINASQFIKILNEGGGFIQFIPGVGWINTIGNFEPGEGYYIKVNANTNIVLNTAARAAKDNNFSITSQLQFFNLSFDNNPYFPMNVVITDCQFDNINLKTGDEIGVYDGNLCVGASVISEEQFLPLTIIVSADDPLTDVVDGFTEGHTLTFKYMSSDNDQPVEVYSKKIIDTELFTPLETIVCWLTSSPNDITNPNTETLNYKVHIYPNPSKNIANIEIDNYVEGHIKIEIINLNGNTINILTDEFIPEGFTKINFDLSELQAGLYSIKIIHKSDKNISTSNHKLIITK